MITPKKRFGQNFLHDQNVINKIISAINPQQNQHILEIGPGLGALTKNILPIVKHLEAVEIDSDLISELKKECTSLGELIIYQEDALKFDFTKVTKNKCELRVIGNLPYNISSPLIFHLLDNIHYLYDMHFMLQKEIVERITAKPNNKIYGRLSVMVQYFCDAELLFIVNPNSFHPAPKVDSAFLRLIPRKKIETKANNINNLSKIVKQAFNQRRKTIQNSLKGLISEEQLISLEINPKFRAEQLSVDDFVRISNCYLKSKLSK